MNISNQPHETDGPMKEPPARPITSWRQSRWLARFEFLAVGLIFLADYRHVIPVSKTPFLLLLGWSSMRVRGVKWRDLGFVRYRSWPISLGLGVAVGLMLETFQLYVTQPLLARLTGKQPDLADFRIIQGNVRYALIAFALTWTLAAVGEELVWRGYLMNRVADVGKSTRVAWICSLFVVNIAFGFAHSYQGITGIIEESLAGLALGAMYLGTGKNLAVPIIAHGVCDTLDLALIFFGKYPGL